ncbi:MAG: HD domain-containing protein, partial [Candidatus Omnitrophica bacterium]|nr:HD domain-containing protein [Candidatus Omnitrophota bacterium]
VSSPQFKSIETLLLKIRAVNPPIKYIYILAPTGKKGIWQFAVDPEYRNAGLRNKHRTSYPGDTYDASRFPEMMRGLREASADKKLEKDEWGVTLSGYAPIRDAAGTTVGVLGVDILADDVRATQTMVHHRALLVLFLGILVSIVLSFLISGRVTGPLRSMVEGTRHIGKGDLSFSIDIGGDDEINELASSFNQMTAHLAESRKKMLTYFYRVVQSLVRIIEARDPYTKGHSERVAEYSGRIAQEMGFPADKIELLKEATLIHDIGKLAISEAVLNKKEKLTEKEWEIIRQHPVLGEEMLKPVLFPSEIIEIVRGHHERHDGTGYPDKKDAATISLMAAIVSVADAYDAMTTVRAYRAPLSKEDAIAELIKNKGSQFSPKVVDVLIRILNGSV